MMNKIAWIIALSLLIVIAIGTSAGFIIGGVWLFVDTLDLHMSQICLIPDHLCVSMSGQFAGGIMVGLGLAILCLLITGIQETRKIAHQHHGDN